MSWLKIAVSLALCAMALARCAVAFFWTATTAVPEARRASAHSRAQHSSAAVGGAAFLVYRCIEECGRGGAEVGLRVLVLAQEWATASRVPRYRPAVSRSSRSQVAAASSSCWRVRLPARSVSIHCRSRGQARSRASWVISTVVASTVSNLARRFQQGRDAKAPAQVGLQVGHGDH